MALLSHTQSRWSLARLESKCRGVFFQVDALFWARQFCDYSVVKRMDESQRVLLRRTTYSSSRRDTRFRSCRFRGYLGSPQLEWLEGNLYVPHALRVINESGAYSIYWLPSHKHNVHLPCRLAYRSLV